MVKINSNWYTKGKFDRKNWRNTLDIDNEYLYSKGRYPTKIREKDLPKDYTKFQSRTIWYMTGFVKTSGVKDLYYTYVKENHLFKDDYLYISYDKKIEKVKDKDGYDEIINYDFLICGSNNIDVLFAIEENSNIDTKSIRNKIKEKFEWWKEHEQEDYKRWFEEKEVTDIFEYYKGLRNAKTYFISDTHFNHKNIIKYCNRPFKDVKEMNETLIENWNNTVTDFDTVFHLGDVSLTIESDMKELIPKLKGKKALIRGNHDKESKDFFRNVGFDFILESPVKLDNEKLILSHKPLKDTEIPDGYVNVHGHIHNNSLHKVNPDTNEMEYPKNLYSEKLHINVSADVIDFKPISLMEILNEIEGRKRK